MSYNFSVGDKVVCVDAEKTRKSGLPELIEGKVYTIRELITEGDGSLCVKTVEIFRDYGHPVDRGFYAHRFRPVQSNSIELFRKIAQGVSDGKPIVEDKEYREPGTEVPLEEEALRYMWSRL